MARAGVGRLRIIDRDFVEWSNLQRQFLFDESDAAEALPKAVAAARRLARVNSEVKVEPMVADLTAANVEDLLEDIDLILDGTDNFETRFLINDAAVDREIPGSTARPSAATALSWRSCPARRHVSAASIPSPHKARSPPAKPKACWRRSRPPSPRCKSPMR